MNHPVAPADAKGSLPTWTGVQGSDEADHKLLKPTTRETARSRWGSDFTVDWVSGNGKGTILDERHNNQRTNFLMANDVRSLSDLELVKSRRQPGEEHLRSALSTVGTLATDITRRLDYTYYSLLEKVAALTSTFASFQELSDSASTIFDDIERETSVLDGDIRRQIADLGRDWKQSATESIFGRKRRWNGRHELVEGFESSGLLLLLVYWFSWSFSSARNPRRCASALAIRLPEPASGEVWSRDDSCSETRPGCNRKSHSAPTPSSPTFNAMTTHVSSDPLRKIDEL